MLPLEPTGENLFLPLPRLWFADNSRSLVSLQSPHSIPRLCILTVFTSSHLDTSLIGLRVHPNLVCLVLNQLHLWWPSFQMQSESEVLGLGLQPILWGGHNSIPNNHPAFHMMAHYIYDIWNQAVTLFWDEGWIPESLVYFLFHHRAACTWPSGVNRYINVFMV